MNVMTKSGLPLRLVLVSILLSGWWPGHACDIPVFRYALDNWPADFFRGTLFHEGPLSKTEKQLLSKIWEDALSENPSLNLQIETVDLSTLKEPPDLWTRVNSPQPPVLVVTYPDSVLSTEPVGVIDFDSESVENLMESPKRKELVSRLRSGHSAVWVFLESGNAELDEPAMATLKSALEDLEKTLDLPPVEDDPNAPVGLIDPDVGEGPPLRIEFSVLSLDRKDPQERLLVNLLMHSEPDLLSPEYSSKPMVFPVYGRGRVLYALIGEGINPDVIREACEFLVGPCSCQVKDLNPGSTDLLLTAKWGEWSGDPMQGLQAFAAVKEGKDLIPEKASPSKFPVTLVSLLVLQGLLVVVVSVFLLVRRRAATMG